MERKEREALDRHITGNYGEDQLVHEITCAACHRHAKEDDEGGFICLKCNKQEHECKCSVIVEPVPKDKSILWVSCRVQSLSQRFKNPRYSYEDKAIVADQR
jgi:hypothetical protein